MSEVFFTSDTHFGHRAVIEYSERPFYSVEEMDSALILNWNSVVRSNDIVFHCGDVSFHKSSKTVEILSRLNGRIRLVRGNHDKKFPVSVSARFEWIKDYYEFKDARQTFVLSHYPFDTWNKSHHGSWHLHGHSHGSLTTIRPGRLDVGVDCHDYTPWSLEEVTDALKDQEYVPVDHHKARE